jgi:tripartite-type tricarboxylate transporter receptor subunit TctC
VTGAVDAVRHFFGSLAIVAMPAFCILLPGSTASAQTSKPLTAYPARVVRWVVPYPPGASNDVVARLVAQKLTQTWGQQVVIDNRSGAGGLLGADIVAKAMPDGYTLLLANPGSNAINFALRTKTPYKPADFAPVSLLGWSPIMLVTSASFPANGVKDVIAMARAKPGQLTGGSSGTGGSSHLALELFKMLAGVDVLHVAYKGAAPAISDILGGQVSLIFTTPVTAAPLVQAGKLKVLAVAGSQRLSIYPEIPTTAEQGLAGFDVLIWFGVSAPAGVPRPVLLKLNRDLQQMLQAPDVRERFAALGLEPKGSTPEGFDAIINEDIERLRKVVKAANVRTE